VVVGVEGLTSCTRNCRCYNVYEINSGKMGQISDRTSNVDMKKARQDSVELRTYTIMVASRGMLGESCSVVKRSSGLVVYPVYPTVAGVGLLGLAGNYCRSMLAMMLEQLSS
jgi:hypothetical protein